ncbi:MAG: hypothetical protein K2L51_00515 [Clostridiales bacterium]|nr:hypothetical protein [Clostridiales bacterium]
MDNLEIYEKVRTVPETAQRAITAGRLKGKTDINPMWRIKTLTEVFGICGYGWRYEITDKRMDRNPESAEIAAFVDINLYIKVGDEWSMAIPGTGGSTFVAEEKSGLHMSDECFKMALTDALSVACKALGMGADVYWNADATKYDAPKAPAKGSAKSPEKEEVSISDIWKLPGADKASNATLFCKALEIAGLSNESGASIVQELFGEGVKVNSLNKPDFKLLIKEVEKRSGNH